jgi:hypothetical protein
MEPFSFAKFVMDFAKAAIDWYEDIDKSKTRDAERIAAYLHSIAAALSDYSDLMWVGDAASRGKLIQNRYYLDAALVELAQVIGSHEEHPAASAVARLRKIKVHDGALAPEVSALLEGSSPLSKGQLPRLADDMQHAAGELKAAPDFVLAKR